MPILYDDRFIKQPNLEEEYTVDQIQTLARCATDINYFLQFVQIVTLDKGRQRFDPYQYQKDLINMFNNNRWNIALLSRQSGKSTTVGAWALQYAIFNRDKFIGIVSNKEKAAKDILRRIKLMYTELPFWMKPGVVEWNKTAIEFDNGTRIEVSATSESAFRGRSINVLIMDEFAFVPPGQAEEFWAANYPALSASVESKLIIISTPNGMFNLFHQLYTAAEKKINAFSHYFADWTVVPGRDAKWAEIQRKNLGETRFAQEFACIAGDSLLTLKDNDTGEIKTLTIEEAYELLNL